MTKIWAKMVYKDFFLLNGQKKASAEGRSPLQELEEGPRSGPHLLVLKTWRLVNSLVKVKFTRRFWFSTFGKFLMFFINLFFYFLAKCHELIMTS